MGSYYPFVEGDFIVLDSPDGTRWKVSIGNDGVLVTEVYTE